MHVLADEDLVWSQPKTTGDTPCKMAAHAGCAVHSILYLFGGMNENGASMDDLYSLNTGAFLSFIYVVQEVSLSYILKSMYYF